MEGVDWKEIAALMAIVGMFLGVVIRALKYEQQLKQIRYHLGLDDDGNPIKGSDGKPRRQIDSDFVRTEVSKEVERYNQRKESRPTIPVKDGESA